MSNNEKPAPSLFLVIDSIENNRVSVANDWIRVKGVSAVFHERKISIKKFKNAYAIPIIEYFIAVVRDEKEMGDCPIMSKLVHYLLKKDITPREVFDICMGFRRELVTFLLKQKTVLENPISFLDEVATIFDANLSGVLAIFTSIYEENQRKIEIAKQQKNKLNQTLKIMNFLHTKIIIVQNSRIVLANRPFLEMLGVKDLKGLYSKYKNGFNFLSDVSTYKEKFQNNISEWIDKTCEKNKAFQSVIYNEHVGKNLNYSGRVTHMPGEEKNQYIIALSNISDHVKDEKTLQDNLTHDELTGFRNYPTFERLISEMLSKAKKNNDRLFLAVTDIPKLRDINHHEGRDAGDLVISEVAEDLRYLVDEKIYFARLEGSRFGILMYYPTEQASYDWCVTLFKKMQERKNKKTLAITEVDLAESTNKLFLRAYDLIEQSNSTEDNAVLCDFTDVMEYRELPGQKQFIDKLSKINVLEISLFYMELPIISQVKVLSTEMESVNVRLSVKQMKVAQIDMSVYFKLENIGNIKSYIDSIDLDKGIVTLNEFRLDKQSPLNRKVYRVQAEENIKAYISDNNRDYDVEVLDMNNEYIAVKIDRKRNFEINSLVYLEMLLPKLDYTEPCATNATITRIDKVRGGYKIVLLCHLDHENRELLSNYISKHQMDIIQNLK